MTIAFSLLMTLLLVFYGQVVTAADPAPMVDAKLANEGDLWQGQRVVIQVTIKTPDTFASAPTFDLPQVPGLILIPPTGSPVLGTEMIGDDSYTTQLHEVTLFPQKSGTVTLPPFAIRFDSNAGFGKPVHSRNVTTPAVSFTVKRPPGTEHLAMVLTTTKLEISETWKPEPGKEPGKEPVAVGAAFTRTIQITADNLPGIVLPNFSTKPPEGMRVYHQSPKLNDQDNRGDLIGQRTETITFACEHSGQYELPAMSVLWWDPKEQTLHEATLPAHSFTVTAPLQSESPEQAIAPPVSPFRSRSSLLMAIGLMAVAVCGGYWWWPAIRQRWYAHQRAVAKSEPHAFRAVVAACRSGDAAATYRALLAWQSKFVSDSSHHSKPFFNDARLASELKRLESHLYGLPHQPDSSPWSPQELLSALTRFRHSFRHQYASSKMPHRLPSLNPHPVTTTPS